MLPYTKILTYLQNRHRGLLLSLLLAVALIYIPYINNPLFFDDLPFLVTRLTILQATLGIIISVGCPI